MRLSDTEVFNIYLDCLKTLSSLGPDYTLDPSILDFKFISSESILGACTQINDNGKFMCRIAINKRLCKTELFDHLQSVLYHELCHCLQHLYLFKLGSYKLLDNNRLKLVRTVELAREEINDYHGIMWQKFISYINSTLNLKVPITQKPTAEQLEFLKEGSI